MATRKKKKKKKKRAQRNRVFNSIDVLWLNNDGGGYAEKIRVRDGTTVEQLREKMLPDAGAADCTVRVNRDIAAAGQTLLSGDRVSVTPKNVSGAR